MNEVAFVEKREPNWKRLAELCDRADLSPSNLNSGQIREVYRLYRSVSGDLAHVLTRSHNEQLIEFLNNLTARAYALLYRSRGKGFRRGVAEAAALAARTFRRRVWFVFASAALFVGSAVTAYVVMGAAPESRDYFVPPGLEEAFDSWKSKDMEERSFSESVLMTMFYTNNNPTVSIITGAAAASTFGLFTAQMLFSNGAMLGALTRDLEPVGRVGYLYARVLPHGVTELSGIVVSGAAGFVMGWALICPGRRRRADALRDAGKDAVVLLAASVVLMFIAAPIEGFFSFNPRVPEAAKIALAAISALAWGAFWFGYGREEPLAMPAAVTGRQGQA